MMKLNNSTHHGRVILALAVAVLSAVLTEPAYCQSEEPVILIQVAPTDAGTVTPGAGIHRFELYSDVTLTAAAKPGYQFIYWLGDVSDPTANTTAVHIDGPKIIIAVFERVEYEFLSPSEIIQSMPIGGAFDSFVEGGPGGFGAPGGKRPHKFRWPSPPEPPKPPDFPVPEPGEDFPVPVPEPVTIAFMGMGAAFVFVTKRSNKRWSGTARSDVIREHTGGKI